MRVQSVALKLLLVGAAAALLHASREEAMGGAAAQIPQDALPILNTCFRFFLNMGVKGAGRQASVSGGLEVGLVVQVLNCIKIMVPHSQGDLII
jgi:hypothetical protein